MFPHLQALRQSNRREVLQTFLSARLSAGRAFGGVPRAIARFFRSSLSAADLGGLSVTETQGLEESFNPKEVPIARVNSPKNLVLAILVGKE